MDLKGAISKDRHTEKRSKTLQSVLLGLLMLTLLSLMFYGEIFSLLISVMKSCFLHYSEKYGSYKILSEEGPT